MNKLKRTLIIGAGVASIGVAGITGVASASALTSTDSSASTSLIDKLASKFNLNKSDVQAVFDANRTEHQAAMKTERTAALKTALSDGKITQVQYDHIVNAQVEIDALVEASGPREDQSDETKTAIKAKFDALRSWFKEQNLSPKDLGLGGGPGGPRDGHGPNDETSSSSTTTNN